MKSRLPFFVSVLLSAVILYLVVTQTEPPKTLKEASFFQLISLFLPLSALAFSLSHLIFNQNFRSFIFTSGIVIFLLLRSLSSLSIFIEVLVAALTITPLFLLKNKESKKHYIRIPKLSELHKQ